MDQPAPSRYTVERASVPAELPSPWDGPFWSRARTLDVAHFHPQSSSTHPVTRARVLYDDSALYLHFRVADQFVRAVQTQYQSMVCHDSCAEFFVQPRADKGYFNFELNPIGTLLLFYVTDPNRVGEGLKEYQPIPEDAALRVRIFSAMQQPTAQEIPTPTEWWLQYAIPFDLFTPYVGAVRPSPGDRWRANFYKCGDRTSRPHWASWSPIGPALNFHRPDTFGELVFA